MLRFLQKFQGLIRKFCDIRGHCHNNADSFFYTKVFHLFLKSSLSNVSYIQLAVAAEGKFEYPRAHKKFSQSQSVAIHKMNLQLVERKEQFTLNKLKVFE